jgi:hypothetical protein
LVVIEDVAGEIARAAREIDACAVRRDDFDEVAFVSFVERVVVRSPTRRRASKQDDGYRIMLVSAHRFVDHCCLPLLSAGGDGRSTDAGMGGAGGVGAGTVRVEVCRVAIVPPLTVSRVRYCVRSPSLALHEVIVPPPNAGREVH